MEERATTGPLEGSASRTGTGAGRGVRVVLSRKKQREVPESNVKVCKASTGAVPGRVPDSLALEQQQLYLGQAAHTDLPRKGARRRHQTQRAKRRQGGRSSGAKNEPASKSDQHGHSCESNTSNYPKTPHAETTHEAAGATGSCSDAAAADAGHPQNRPAERHSHRYQSHHLHCRHSHRCLHHRHQSPHSLQQLHRRHHLLKFRRKKRV
ncbi:unnamed protein product [Closterium sp. NIES-53]